MRFIFYLVLMLNISAIWAAETPDCAKISKTRPAKECRNQASEYKSAGQSSDAPLYVREAKTEDEKRDADQREERADSRENQNTDTEKRSADSSAEQARASWLAVWISAVGTFIAIFGTIYLIKTFNQTRRSADIAERQMIHAERAYVFIQLFEIDKHPNVVVITPRWRNSGNTPTRDLELYSNWKIFGARLPADYHFPDLDKTGNEVSSQQQPHVLQLGPDCSNLGLPAFIPPEVIPQIQNGHIWLYLWGRAEYRDIFGNKRVTKYCKYLEVDLVGQTDIEREMIIRVSAHNRHNCADEECNKC